MDPFNEHNDLQLWNVLDEVRHDRLKSSLSSSNATLADSSS